MKSQFQGNCALCICILKMVPANKPVNMTFMMAARERYLWTLEPKRQGRTVVSLLRNAMEKQGEQDG